MSLRISKYASSAVRERIERLLSCANGNPNPSNPEVENAPPNPTPKDNEEIPCSSTQAQANQNMDFCPSSSDFSNSSHNTSRSSSRRRKLSVLYKWPSDTNASTIAPCGTFNCPITGNELPVYNKNDCSPMFIVPSDGPINGVPHIESCSSMEGELAKLHIDPAIIKTGGIRAKSVPRKNQKHPVASTSRQSQSQVEGVNGSQPIKIPERKEATEGPRLPSKTTKMLCTFCKSNGEHPDSFHSHRLLDKKRGVVCPVLSQLVCPQCNATGRKAHTIKYCPKRSKKQQIRDHSTLPRVVRTATGRYKLSRY